jgi:HEAT repeat protein
MGERELRELIAQPEGLKLDFKRGYKFNHPDQNVRKGQWDEFIKDVLALINGNVGVADQSAYLVIGVGDELHSDGTRDLFDTRGLGLTGRLILDKVNSACRPPLPDILYEVVELDGKEIIVVTTPPSPYLHETTRRLESVGEKGHRVLYSENTVFIRRNEEIHPASETERRALDAEKKALLFRPRSRRVRLVKPLPTQWDSVDAHRAALARISRYARWSDVSRVESYIRETGMRLPLFASPYDDLSSEQVELLETIHAHDRLLILGDPGMGKTVALERTVWETASASEPVVPVYVPLIHYNGDLLENIRVALRETGHLLIKNSREVGAFIDQHRCMFLFDGLNEVASSHREEIHAELGNFLRAQANHPCIVTSRSQDNLWRRFHSREVMEDAVVIQRITDNQARAYLIAHLGEQQGRELYDRLNEALRGLSRIPLLLWLIKEAGLAGEELPGNRGQLFDRFVDQVLKREEKQPELVKVPGLVKKRALSNLAFQLQREHRLACDRKRAVNIINQTEGVSDSEAVVRESLLNGLLVGERQVHFLHQAVHEYFVALHLKDLALGVARRQGRAHLVTRLAQTVGIEQDIRDWAKDDWWAESMVQLAGLVENPDRLVQEVLAANPWLAYWCMIEGQSVGEKTRRMVEAKTVSLLESAAVRKRLRAVHELARMENPRTVKHLILALCDVDDTVVRVASQTLSRLGEPAVEPLLAFLGTSKERLSLAATRVLGAIWQFPELVGLGDADRDVRCAAAETLGMTGDKRTVVPLTAALRDKNAGVRRCSAEALGRLRDARALQPLIAALSDGYKDRSGEHPVRRSAAAALKMFGDVQAVESLIGLLRGSSESERWIAIQALGEIWRLPELVELSDSNSFKRQAAAVALGRLGDIRAIEPLLATLQDQVEQVRWAVTRALGEIWHWSELVRLGDSERDVRRSAAMELGGLGDTRAIEPLLAALRDSDKEMRRSAAMGLGRIGAPAVEPLVATLQSKP